MISKKLFSLLGVFSRTDITRLRKFLQSPFFNENEMLRELLERLLPLVNDPDNTTTKEDIWQALFPQKKYNDLKMRRLISDLIQQCYQFMSFTHFDKHPFAKQEFLLENLKERGLNKHFEKINQQAIEQTENPGNQNADLFYHQYRLQQLRYEYQEVNRKDIKTALGNTDFQLDCFYIFNKLKSYCDLLGYKNFIPIDVQINEFPAYLDKLENSNFLEIPGIRAYFLVAKMLLFPDDEFHFQRLKTYLFNNDGLFSREELNLLFTHLINYCIHIKINVGKTQFFAELFDIQKVALEKKIIIVNNQLDFHHYKNIITTGLRVKDFEWVEYFIEEYTDKLPAAHRENARNYNLAKVFFSQKKYDRVIELLQSVTYKNHVYALGGKLILLKTYYERQELVAMDSLIDSFRIYIRRNQHISRDVKQQYLNVLRFVKKMASITPGDQKALTKLKGQLDRCKALADKTWIMEKVAELE